MSTRQFDFRTRLGLSFIVLLAFLSAISIVCLLLYIAYSTIRVRRDAQRKWPAHTHLHWYFLSLMFFELISAISWIMDIRWIQHAKITEGHFCIAQGVFQQLGAIGVALTVLVIAVHTCSIIVFQWQPQSKVALFAIWLFSILTTMIGVFADYYGNTGHWCWVKKEYLVQRILLAYVWMWITALLNILIYVPIALSIIYNRIIIVHAARKAEKRAAMGMLFYPAIYTATVLPMTIARWLNFTKHQQSELEDPLSPGFVVASVIFASSGVLNVLLFVITRPSLLPTHEGSAVKGSPKTKRFTTCPDTPVTGSPIQEASI